MANDNFLSANYKLPDRYGSGNVLEELGQNPTARKNKYNALGKQKDVLERHADFLYTRLKNAEKSGNQSARNAILQQLQSAESRINVIVTEMNSIAESSRYSEQEANRQQKITDSKPKTMMDNVRESLPYQIGSGIRDMIVDTGKGIGQTARYAENAILNPTQGKTAYDLNGKGFNTLEFGKAGTQLNPNTMQMEDIYMKDVLGEYTTALGENTGMYVDAMNSMRHWFTNNKFGSKPDSEDGKYAKMFGNKARDVVGTTPLQDDTVIKGARVLADPLAVVGGAVKGAKVTTKAIDEFADIAKGFRTADGRYIPMSQAGMFMPMVMWSDKGRRQLFKTNNKDWLGGYSPQMQDAYRKFEELSAQGVDPREIFKQTRILRNVDGMPYFETDDSLAKFGAQEFRDAIASGKKGIPLREAMSHPELTDADYAYPYQANRETYVLPQKELGAGYNPIYGTVTTYPYKRTVGNGEVVDDFNANMIHETNHKLSGDSNIRNSGTNLDMAKQQLNEYKKDMAESLDVLAINNAKLDAKIIPLNQEYNRINDLISQNDYIPSNEDYDVLIRQRTNVGRKLEALEKKKRVVEKRINYDINLDARQEFDLYLRNNGEALSRMSEARMSLDDMARRNTYPLDEDYFKQVTGFKPNETWFNRYDINKTLYENDLVFPDSVSEEIKNYLQKGTKPFTKPPKPPK